MSSVQYENQILEAIQTIVDNAVSRATYDRTLKGVISKCVDEAEGKYVIKYQDSSFYAYGKSGDPVYSNGTYVYVLVPGNDMTQKKTIVGTVDDLGKDYVEIIESAAGYEVVGNSVIEDNFTEHGLCSYLTGQQILLYDKQDPFSALHINVNAANEYLKNCQYLICGADFRTALPDEQKLKGNYGLYFEMSFKDAGTDNIINKTYVIDINNMNGNPYMFTETTNQKIVFEIDGENFVSIDRIYMFQSNFPNRASDKPNDIFILNVTLEGAVALTKEELAGYSLSFVTPQGIYFDNNDLDTAIREIQTVVRVKGKKVNSSSSALQYYWFKENNTISISSPEYNHYGGKGWECLNPYNTTKGNNTREWLSGNWNYITKKSDNVAQENSYKCVIVYNNTIVISKEIIIKNKSSNYNISISTDEGRTIYNYESGIQPLLTCYVNAESQTSNEWMYKWVMIDVNNQYYSLSSSDEDIEINDNTLWIKNLGVITNLATFKCYVYKNYTFVGKAAITIQNSKTVEANPLTLTLLNNNQVFKYNGEGVSPTTRSNEYPQEVYPLSFILYDKEGKQINFSKIKSYNIAWTVPTQDTLLVVSGDPDYEDVEKHTKTYLGLEELYFDISILYSTRKTNNSIWLTVTYEDYSISARADITCIKEGEVGTNGTDFICRIVPYQDSADLENYYPTCFLNKANTTISFNFNALGNNIPFKINFWHDGQLIYNDYDSGRTTEDQDITLNWRIKKNQYQNTQGITYDALSDYSDFNFTIGGTLSRNTVTKDNSIRCQNPANILECEILYLGKKYYATMPLITSWSQNANMEHKILLKRNSGFRDVQYNMSGGNPQYDNRNPFELTVLEKNGTIYTDITKSNALTYEWTMLGAVYDYEYNANIAISKYQINLEEFNLGYVRQPYQFKYKPIDLYSGYCVTNAVKCTVKKNGTEVAYVHIPIDFYLNRFGNANINEWDGNSLKIDNKGGLILSPQVGAGVKDNNNRFTGVFMGQVQHNGEDPKYGLYGYNEGVQTIALSAQDGSAKFGKNGGGQIIIQPGNDTATIKSGNYSETAKTGMEIDLTDPHIKFGSGKFAVDNDGILSATGVNVEGEINATSGHIAGFDIVSSFIKSSNNLVALNSNPAFLYAFWAGSDSGVQAPFSVRHDGTLKATSATITGAITATSLTLGNGVTVPAGKIDGLDTAIDTEVDNLHVLYQGDVSHTRTTSTDGHLITDVTTFKDSSGTTQSYTTYTSTSDGYVYTNVGIGTQNTTSHNTNYIKVSKNGLLEADNAIIYGTIYAGAGQIAGWSIGSTAITKGKVGLSSDNTANTNIAIWAGNTTSTSAPFKVDFNGKVTASSGAIGGWTLGSTKLYSGSGTTYVGLDSGTANQDYAIWAGNATAGSAPFRVTRAGALTATSATITGTVNATTGEFGNGTNKITIGTNGTGNVNSAIYSGSKSTLNSTNDGFYIGTNGIALGTYNSSTGNPFQVTTDGTLTTKKGNIAGFTIASNVLSSSDGTVGLCSSIDPMIWAGATSLDDRINAPFRIDEDGSLYASKGEIGGCTIDDYGIYSGSGSTTAGIGLYGTRYAFWAGGTIDNTAGAAFCVSHGGSLTATTGSIAGWNMDIRGANRMLTAATDNGKVTGMAAAAYPGDPVFFAGGPNPWDDGNWTNNVPFYVTNTGLLKTSSLACTGGYVHLTYNGGWFRMGNGYTHPQVSGLNINGTGGLQITQSGAAMAGRCTANQGFALNASATGIGTDTDPVKIRCTNYTIWIKGGIIVYYEAN